MAKQSTKPEIQKLDNKNINFGLVKNVNDEVIPGFKTLQNVNPGNIAKSFVQRAGLRQNAKGGTISVTTTNNYNANDQSITNEVNGKYYGALLSPIVDYSLSAPGNLYNTMFYAFQVAVPYDMFLLNLKVQIRQTKNPGTLPAGTKLKCSIYNGVSPFGPKQLMPSLVATASVTYDLTLTNQYTYSMVEFDFVAPLVELQAGHNYICELEIIKNSISDLPFQNIEFRSIANSDIGQGIIITSDSANKYAKTYQSYTGDPNSYLPWFSVGIGISSNSSVNGITHIQPSNQDSDSRYYISGVQDGVNKSGVIKNQEGYLNLNTTKMIDPASVNGITVLNQYTGQGIINPLDFVSGYPGSFYGFKAVGSFHNWIIALGSQLKNKVPVIVQPTPGLYAKSLIIDNPNYMIAKRYTIPPDPGIETVIPCTADVIQDPVTYVVSTIEFTNGINLSGIKSGQYEYAIEWIDEQGFSYAPGTYDPATINKNAVSYKSKYDYDTTSMKSYVQRNQNTRFMVDLTFNNPSIPNGSSAGMFNGNYGDFIANNNHYSVAFTIPLPKSPTPYGWSCNIYRRRLTQVDDTKYASTIQSEQYPILYPGEPFIKLATFNTLNSALPPVINFTDNFYEPILTTSFDLDLYMPRPADMDEFKGHIIAVGDPIYPNYIWPSRNDEPDFHVQDAFQVAFPAGDTYFNACMTFNDCFYAFSNHGTWQISFIGGQTPFVLKQISNKLGCISTSKGIVKVGNRLLMPTVEGLKMFDGANFANAEGSINNIWNNIDIKQQDINLGGTPAVVVGHVPAYDVTGAYDPSTKQVIYKIPAVGEDPPTIYVLNVENLIKTTFASPFQGTGDGTWQTYDNTLNLIDFYEDPFENAVGCTDGNNLFVYDKTLVYDALTNTGGLKTNDIDSVMESSDIDFGEATIIKSFRIWGNGIVTLSFYIDRELTTLKILPGETLDLYGAKGLQANLGYKAQYFRWKIESTDPNFQFKGVEILYSNKGIKSFDTMA